MKTKLLALIIMMFTSWAYISAQDKPNYMEHKEQIERMTKEISSLRSNQVKNQVKINELNVILEKQGRLLDSLCIRIEGNEQTILKVKENAQKNIHETNNSLKATSEILVSNINSKSLYAGTVGFIAVLLAIVFFIIHRRIIVKKSNMVVNLEIEIDKLTAEQKTLESTMINSNSKVIDVIEKQLSIINKNISSNTKSIDEIDHSLAISVANELTRIQQNLSHMDEKVKGVSQLKNRAKAILTTLNSKQYDIPDLLGREYHEGDNIIATMELNEDLEVGRNRIKRVIKPQVSYNGKLIQAAEVVVEYNE